LLFDLKYTLFYVIFLKLKSYLFKHIFPTADARGGMSNELKSPKTGIMAMSFDERKNNGNELRREEEQRKTAV